MTTIFDSARLLVMKTIFTLFLSLLSITVTAQQKSVLFIGNSYTYGNDLPSLLRNLATANNHDLYVDSYSVGGATFANHASSVQAMNKIKARNWDYVIIQGQSQEPAFPDNQVNTSSLPAAMRLADSVYANNYCTEVMMFMTWGRKNGDSQWAPISTYEGMQTRLYNGYMRIADSSQASVAAVGQVWRSIRNSMPDVELYEGDQSHPVLAGSYLAAMTIYSSIYLELATNFVGSGNLSAEFLDQINVHIQADILDNLDVYHLRPSDNHTVLENLTVTQAGNVIEGNAETRKAQSVHWSFGDGADAQGWTTEHTYNSMNTFTLNIEARSECNVDAETRQIVVDVLAIAEVQSDFFQIIDNVITVNNNIEAMIYTSSGQEMARFKKDFDLTNLPSGVYLFYCQGSFNRIFVK